MSIVKMAPDIPDDAWDHSELDKYGIGNGKMLFCVTVIKKLIDYSAIGGSLLQDILNRPAAA